MSKNSGKVYVGPASFIGEASFQKYAHDARLGNRVRFVDITPSPAAYHLVYGNKTLSRHIEKLVEAACWGLSVTLEEAQRVEPKWPW